MSQQEKNDFTDLPRGGPRAAVTSKRLSAINYYQKALHFGCCSSPKSASASCFPILEMVFSLVSSCTFVLLTECLPKRLCGSIFKLLVFPISGIHRPL